MEKLLALLLLVLPVTACSQASFTVNGTKLNLAGAGTDLTNYYSISSPSLSAPLTWTLPSTAGTSGYFLRTDGAGNLSWASASSSGMTNPMTTLGDIIYGSTGGTPVRLGIGGQGAMLLSYGGTPWWAANPYPYENSATLTSGNYNDLAISYNAIQFASGTASGATVTGIAPAAAYNVVRIFNGSAVSVTIANENSNSAAANRFITLTGADEVMPSGGCKVFTYVANSYTGETRWVETTSVPPISTGTVTSIATNNGITGGTITGSGTIGLDYAHNNTWTTQQEVDRNGLGAINNDGDAYLFNNTTASTSGTPVQISPGLEMVGHEWNTISTADEGCGVYTTLYPVSGATPTAYEVWKLFANGGAYAEKARLTSDGVFSPTTGFQINHASATAGDYLRSNGTNFVDGTIAVADLPTITVAHGGTGQTTLTNHGVLVGAGTSAITQIGVGGANTVLEGNASADPSFGTLATDASLRGNGIGAPFGIALGNTNVWTAYQELQTGSVLAATYADGLDVFQTTPSSAVNTAFYSPSIKFQAHSWATGGTPADVEQDARITLIPTTGTATSGYLAFELGAAGSFAGTPRFAMYNGNESDFCINGASRVADANISMKDGHLQSQQTTAPTSATKSIGCGTAGTGGTAAMATLANATDVAGKITVSTTDGAAHAGGINPAAGAIVEVDYSIQYVTSPIVELTPADAMTAAIQGYIQQVSTSRFTIGVTVAPPGNIVTTYAWYYHIIETQ